MSMYTICWLDLISWFSYKLILLILFFWTFLHCWEFFKFIFLNWSVDLLFFLIKKCISYNCWFHIGHYLYHQPISQSNSARLSKVCHLWEVQLANHQILLIFEVFYSYGLVVTYSTYYRDLGRSVISFRSRGQCWRSSRSYLRNSIRDHSSVDWWLSKGEVIPFFSLWQALLKDL